MAPPTESELALAGVRVLDLTRVLAGPLCTMILGDLGAEVIKVERPGTGDETREWGPPWLTGPSGTESAYFLSVNRNKRSIAADLNRGEDRALVRRLALEADVVVENFAPGHLTRWGLEPERLARDNPRLVYCSITGFGQEGPDSSRPGYDFTVQARSGWMAVTGEPEGEPVKVGVAVIDVLTGQNAATAILAALLERERSGRGQRVEVTLFDSALAGLVNVSQAALAGIPARRFGNAHPTIVPYQAFETGDETIVVAVGNDEQWRRFCRALGLERLTSDPRFATNPARVEHRAELITTVSARLAEAPADHWLSAFEDAGIPCAPVCSVSEAIRDPVLRERGGVWTMKGARFGEVAAVASPLRLERTPPRLRQPPPALGEHGEVIRSGGWA